MSKTWATVTLDELAWPNDGTWPEFIIVGMGDGKESCGIYVPTRDSDRLRGERDFYYSQVIENAERHDKAYKGLAEELEDTRKLCKKLWYCCLSEREALGQSEEDTGYLRLVDNVLSDVKEDLHGRGIEVVR